MTVGRRRAITRRRGSADRRFATAVVFGVAVLAAFGCASTYRSMTDDEKLEYLLELEENTLAELVQQQPDAQADLDAAVGYAIFSNTATKVPVVGAGEGIGVVVNVATGDRTYLRVQRFDVGGGLGVRKYRVVMCFFDEAEMNKLASGTLEFGGGVEASAGTEEVGTGAGGVAGSRNEKRALYQLSEGGVSATWTVRLIKYSVLDLER